MSRNDHRKKVEALRRLGCTVVRRKSGHYLIVTPSGRKLFTASSPSDHRSWKNLRPYLIREGVDPTRLPK